METPGEPLETKKPFWKKLDLFHWIVLVVAIIVLVILVTSSMGQGIRPLFSAQVEQIPEHSQNGNQ